MNVKKYRTHKAFTIMELMISIVVIGILATLSFKGYDKVMSSANSQKALDQLAQIKAGLARYYRDTGTYPTNLQLLLKQTAVPTECYDAVSLAGNMAEDANIAPTIAGPYVDGMEAGKAGCIKAKVGYDICYGAVIGTDNIAENTDCKAFQDSFGFKGTSASTGGNAFNVITLKGVETNVAVEMFKQANGHEVTSNFVSVTDGNTTDILGMPGGEKYNTDKIMLYKFRPSF
jgi:prepilin-type N-terminal cleavage/methylation domain-containing protein